MMCMCINMPEKSPTKKTEKNPLKKELIFDYEFVLRIYQKIAHKKTEKNFWVGR